ncbi:hypothetical protein [Clostridium sp.]|uniref:hypothetical protein n=1 Tax=Clostridium sp. TaxID=1506 RepID=UPI003079060A
MSLGFIVSLINPAINATSAICCSVIADGAAIHVKSNIIIIRSIRYLGICTASHQTYTAAKGAAFTATHSGNILRNLSSVHNECAIFINSNTAPQGIAVARAICSACDFGVICICYSIIFYRGTLVHCQCAAIDGDTSTHVIVSRKVIGLSTLFIGRMIVSIVLSAGMVVVLDYCTIIQRYLTALNPNCSLIRGQPTSNFTSPRCATVNSNIL